MKDTLNSTYIPCSPSNMNDTLNSTYMPINHQVDPYDWVPNPSDYSTPYNWNITPTINIKFKKMHPDAMLPRANNDHLNVGDSGYDLFAVEDTHVLARQSAIAPIGISLADITPGYWFRIEPRSGLGFKHNLQPHLGVIDNCVPAETLIQTVDGQVTAGELYNMDIHPNIISYNIESNSVDIDKITEMWEVENSELIEIETETGCVKIPPHKTVYTKRGWVAAKDLNTNDYILEYC